MRRDFSLSFAATFAIALKGLSKPPSACGGMFLVSGHSKPATTHFSYSAPPMPHRWASDTTMMPTCLRAQAMLF